MKKSLKYNLTYIGGISGYDKRAIYTLNLKTDHFSVDGIFKSKKFLYADIIEVYFGEVDYLKGKLDIVRELMIDHLALLDRRLNRKLKYCLVIVLKEGAIVFSEEYDGIIKVAYERLIKIRESTLVK